MNIETNEALVRRNARIAQIAMLGGLLVLAAGMLISFRSPTQAGWSFAALMVGFGLSQVGIYYSNRWGRRPRPDELLNAALKGLDSKYTIYHYRTPTSHLLVGPAGVWVLMPRQQRGTITFEKGRWQQKGGNLYLKIFAQEGLGRPELELSGEVKSVQEYIRKIMPESDTPPVYAALVFTNNQADIQVSEEDNAPAATIRLNDLKDLIRKTAKTKPISFTKSEAIQEAIAAQ